MKIGILITVRLKSTRLPFKVLMNLHGKTVIERVIERAKALSGIDTVVVCTSTNPQDLPIAKYALSSGVYCYQGSEEDVIVRLHTAARFHRLNGFLSITADNPLFSIYHAERLVDLARAEFPDYAEVTNVPLGLSIYFLKTKAVEVVCRVKNVSDTEFWPVLIKRSELFTLAELDGDIPEANQWRLTLDTPNDYKLINHLYTHVPFVGVLNEFDVFEYLRENPEVAKINSGYKPGWLNEAAIAEINRHFETRLQDILTVKEEVYRE